MRLALHSPIRKIVFAVACSASSAAFLGLSLREYLAARLAAVPNVLRLEKAIRLEPSDAEYRDLLGRNLALLGESLDAAISTFRTATQLNPYDARGWLDLAGAYQVAGRVREQEESVERAVKADPSTPHVAWEAANLFLVQGEREKALHYLGIVLANDPQGVDPALQMCWRVTGDAGLIVNMLPPRSELYFSLINLLISRQEIAAAESVWNRLIGLRQTFPLNLSFPYFRFLLAKQEVAVANTSWEQLADLNPSLRPYLPSSGNLIVNGGFEENILNGGFDWWYQSNPHTTLTIDTNEFRSGTRSLSIAFDGQSAAEAGISQFIPVKPNTHYAFSAEYKAEELETASGPRFSIIDPYTGTSYVLSEDIVGTNPWRSEQEQFQTGQNTQLLLLRIVRQPANQLIRGQLWIDDLKLVER
jgi:tetratricopeptide (TPR) repeat protein